MSKPKAWTPRDTRPAVPAGKVCEALVAAAKALPDLRRFRLQLPASWGEVRRVVCSLADDERRVALIELLRDEGQRIRHDRTAGMNGEGD